VCKGHIQSSPIGSAYSREYTHYKQQGISLPQPQNLFFQDIRKSIQLLQHQGHAILLMLDSNETLTDGTDLQQFISSCNLFDLHASDPAQSTYIGASNRRTDHMLGCAQITQAIRSSGSLAYSDGPQSDHRGLYVDLDTQSILKSNLEQSPISASASWSLKTGNPELVELYHTAMLQYYADHKMEERLDKMFKKKDKLKPSKLRHLLEQWDADQGRAMKHAESILARPHKPFAWSPILRNSGLLLRYWRLRLREKTHSEDYNKTFQRIEQQTQQHNPHFIFPFRGVPLPTSEIHVQLKQAKLALHACQQSSQDLRYRCYSDLLATYTSDSNPSIQKASERKAKIITNTIKSEQCRSMFANIRTTVKPTQMSSLNRLMVPHHKDKHELPDNYQEFLSNTQEPDIQWDSLVDQ
jgi:hypothetical protein